MPSSDLVHGSMARIQPLNRSYRWLVIRWEVENITRYVSRCSRSAMSESLIRSASALLVSQISEFHSCHMQLCSMALKTKRCSSSSQKYKAKIGEDAGDEALMPESGSMQNNRQVVSSYSHMVLRQDAPTLCCSLKDPLCTCQLDLQYCLRYLRWGTCPWGPFMALLLPNMCQWSCITTNPLCPFRYITCILWSCAAYLGLRTYRSCCIVLTFYVNKILGSFKVAIIQTIICSINFPIKSFSGPFFD